MKFVFLLVLLCAVGSNAGQQELPPGALPYLLFSSVMFHDFNLQVSKASFTRAALRSGVRITSHAYRLCCSWSLWRHCRAFRFPIELAATRQGFSHVFRCLLCGARVNCRREHT